MIEMTESTVVRNTPMLGAMRAEIGHRGPIGGLRARHACYDGSTWIGPVRNHEATAWSDGIAHERRCLVAEQTALTVAAQRDRADG